MSQQQIGPYQIVRELGRGGMGVVYLGFDPAIARNVAIKTILLPDSRSPRIHSLREALIREARAAGSMAHPAIVTVYQLGIEDGLLYLAMEFLPGGTLDDCLEPDIPADPAWSMRALHQLAEGLDYAHAAGFVHRDIKPNNILLADPVAPRVKIADFGLARAMSSMSSQMKIAGTPNYMSPEQINGGRLDGRSDQFALALIAYQLLTGRLAFEAPTFQELLVQILNSEPPLASHLNPRLHPTVDQVFARALAKSPGDRYEKCQDFVSELSLAMEGRLPGATPRATTATKPFLETPAPPPPPKLNARVPLLMLLGVLGLAGITYLGYEVAQQGSSRREPQQEQQQQPVAQTTKPETVPPTATEKPPAGESKPVGEPREELSEARLQLTKRLLENVENDAPVSALQDLVAKGASIKGDGTKVPLVEAARHCNEESVNFFLKQGAKPNIGDSQSEVALVAVIEAEKRRTAGCPARMNIVNTLLAAGASPNRVKDGDAPAGRAARLDPSEGLPIARLLLARGAEPTQALISVYAYEDCPREGVDLLLAAGAKPNGPFQSWQEPPLSSAVKGCAEIVDQLLAKGANVNARDQDGRTALHILLQEVPPYLKPENFRKIVKLLLDHGANVNLPSKPDARIRNPGETPFAVLIGHHELTEFFPTFLDRAGDINRPDAEGRTILHHAVNKCRPEAVKFLLSRGAKPNVRDVHGLTPLTLARKDMVCRNDTIIRTLESAEAAAR